MAEIVMTIALWCAASVAVALLLGRVMAFAKRRDPIEPAVPPRRASPVPSAGAAPRRARLGA